MEQERKYVIAALVIVIAVGAYGVYRLVNRPQEVIIKEGFEGGMENWTSDSDVPTDPNNPGYPVDWEISLTEEITYEGSYSARFYLDGSQDDGTIWLEREISLKPNTRYRAELSLQFYSGSESFNQLAYVVGQVSPVNLEAEENFADLGAANLVEGWRIYDHTITFKTDGRGVAYVGFGVSVVWETEITYLIDQVEVKITPA